MWLFFSLIFQEFLRICQYQPFLLIFDEKTFFVFRNSSQVQKQSHHQFNNGHFQPIFYTSDTETERSLGEVTIPMATFKTQATRKRISDDQILDASQLESV